MWSGPFATQHLVLFYNIGKGFSSCVFTSFPCPASEAEFSFI